MPRKLWLSKSDREWKAWVEQKFEDAFDAWVRGEPGPERDRQYGRMVCIVALGKMRDHQLALDDCGGAYTDESPADPDALGEGLERMTAEWKARAAQP